MALPASTHLAEQRHLVVSLSLGSAVPSEARTGGKLGPGIRPSSTRVKRLSDNQFRLLTLGTLTLLDPTGRPAAPIAKHPRKLAVLAVLALARRPVSRDVLVEMFWGEQDERRARHSLSDALSAIRQVLGTTAVSARRDTVSLDADLPLTIDAIAFHAACGVTDWSRAVALYGGPFLDGVFIKDAPSFETWSANERARLEQLFLRACAEQVGALRGAGRHEAAAEVAARWLAAQPLAPEPALALLAALRAPDTPTAERSALAAYDQLAARLAREYDVLPDPAVVCMAAEIRTALAAAPTEAAFPLSADGRRGALAATSRRRTVWVWSTVAAVTIALASMTYALRPDARAAPAPLRPVVAVLGIRDLRGDSTAAWIGDGLTQMIAADLARSPAIEIVAPERVRQATAALDRGGGVAAGAASGPDDARPVGHALGANWVVTGGLTRGDTTYILDVELYDVARARSLSLYTIVAGTLPTLADRAAARVLAVANSNQPGPRFADIETGSLEAYEHFVRSEEAGDEGREADQRKELDRAIALDSGFVTALAERMRIAQRNGETAVLNRLAVAFRRASARATPWDRLELDTYAALHDAERGRSVALARALVARYPHDPRAYDILAGILQVQGAWAAADSVLYDELALDSLATTPVRGPCAPCTAYRGLAVDETEEGRPTEAERAARQWLDIQPDYPAAWSALAAALQAEGRFDAALVAARRAQVLAPEEQLYDDRVVRALLVARRYDDADTAIARMVRSTTPAVRSDALDLRALLQRERGEIRASVQTIQQLIRAFPTQDILGLEEADGLARLGDYAAAIRLDEPLGHHRTEVPAIENAVTPVSRLIGGRARQFCWVHALEAEDLAGTGDTILLHSLADSIAEQATRSYYGRDWRLAHHVRGLIAEIAGRPADAARELEAARWGYGGWTATDVHLARVELAQGHAADAIATLRDAYAAPLDAMGRYVPRSELDLWMWRAFSAAGRADSAAVYEGYVRRAWRDADPEVRRELSRTFAGD